MEAIAITAIIMFGIWASNHDVDELENGKTLLCIGICAQSSSDYTMTKDDLVPIEVVVKRK